MDTLCLISSKQSNINTVYKKTIKNDKRIVLIYIIFFLLTLSKKKKKIKDQKFEKRNKC